MGTNSHTVKDLSAKNIAAKDLSAQDLSVDDVAAELGMHPETIRRLLLAGEMPGYKAGRVWRVTRAALNGWKAEGGVRRPGRPGKEEEKR